MKSTPRKKIIEKVTKGLLASRPRSYLLVVPPGCCHPNPLVEIERELENRHRGDILLVRMQVDHASNDRALVSRLIKIWCAQDDELSESCNHLSNCSSQEDTLWRLKEFCNYARDRKLIILFQGFDSFYQHMSKELLATLGDLEGENLVACVNETPLDYKELCDRRNHADRRFTSDYGQTHPCLMIGALDEAEALDRWEDDLGNIDDDKKQRRFFRTAYEITGGLPELFEIAVTERVTSPDSDYYSFLDTLKEQVVNSVVVHRLVEHADEAHNGRIVEALAKLYLGRTTPLDRNRLRQHLWSEVLTITTDESTRVRCSAIGGLALDKLLELANAGRLDSESLYRNGAFTASLRAAETASPAPHDLLRIAAEMMSLAYGTSAGSLYFTPSTNWKKLRSLAETAIAQSKETRSKKQFQRWVQIANTFIEGPPADASAIERHLLAQKEKGHAGWESIAIDLGIRILAAEQDKNPSTALRNAIPLVESILRSFVIVKLGLKSCGDAFEVFTEPELAEWWPHPDNSFNRPDVSAHLVAADLALLIAVATSKDDKPFFNDANDLYGVLSFSGNDRALLAHYVADLSEKARKRWLRLFRDLFRRVFEHDDQPVTLDEIAKWIRPPNAFLDEL